MPTCRILLHLSTIASLLLSLVLPRVVRAGLNEWTTGGPDPDGKFVRALALDPSTSTTLYAGTELHGVFRSADAGGSWSVANVGLTSLNVFALAVDPGTPTTLYAGTIGEGVFKSTDGAATWTLATAGFTGGAVLALAVDPVTPTNLYAGSYAGVFKSTDAGATWTQSSPPEWLVNTIAIDPETPTTVYAGMFAVGAFKSLDGGQNWTPINAGLTTTTVRWLAIDRLTPTILAAATIGGGVFLSKDAGGSWEALNDGLTNLTTLTVVIDPTTPPSFHVGTFGSGVFEYEWNDACDDQGTPVVCPSCETCNPVFGCVADVWNSCHQPILPHNAKLHIKDKSPDSRDRIVWKWLRGEATTFAEYGDPLTDTDYTLCIFDLSGVQPSVALRAVIPAAVQCGPESCWRVVGDHRYKYRNGEATPEGLSKLLLNDGEDEKAKIILKGHGELLDVPTLPLNLPALLQLRASNGQCWEGLYTEEGKIQNNAELFIGASGP